MLDVAHRIPRGTIYVARGLPLATGSVNVATQARKLYGKVGIALDSTCKEPFERCYPRGGSAFHLLGDARTRTNWTASNTSYAERDMDSRLRGFNDHATFVNRTIRRDYRDLVPLLRHRHQPEDSAWQEFLNRPRDVSLTIDAQLQARITAILSK